MKPVRWSLLIVIVILSSIFLLNYKIPKAKTLDMENKYGYSMMTRPHEEFKAELGRAAWTFLHTLGSKVPQYPNLEEKERYLNFIIEFSKLYPCKECRTDFQRVLSKYPPRVLSNYNHR